jgi:hypothetical protein
MALTADGTVVTWGFGSAPYARQNNQLLRRQRRFLLLPGAGEPRFANTFHSLLLARTLFDTFGRDGHSVLPPVVAIATH